MSSRPLEGRRVVVTGAGSGLGAAYAEAAAAAGAAVVVNDLSADAAAATCARIEAAGGRAVPQAGDVADWASAKAIVDRCTEAFGGIDGIVNNAGIVAFRRLLEETEEGARRLLDVNVLGTIYPSIHAARAMVDSGTRGSIVNVSSGNQCGHTELVTYGATKGAVSTLTYGWARELEEHGIRVNAISPNAHTGQIDQAIAHWGHAEHAVMPAPTDNAAIVVYLLSDQSSKLTGQIVRCQHGGVHVMAHPVAAYPRIDIDDWTVDNVAAAFSGPLSDQLQPNGLSEAKVEHVRFIL